MSVSRCARATDVAPATLALWRLMHRAGWRAELDVLGFACARIGRARRRAVVDPATVVEPDVAEVGPGEVRL